MPEEEKGPFDDVAMELLKFMENRLENFESKEEYDAYRLMRARVFLERVFGHVQGLQKEVENLKKAEEMWRPVGMAWSERQDLARRGPFSRLEEEGTEL